MDAAASNGPDGPRAPSQVPAQAPTRDERLETIEMRLLEVEREIRELRAAVLRVRAGRGKGRK